MTAELGTQAQPFRLEEATIEELHAAIKSGQITCVEIVQHYIDRVRAYNGVASAPVTPDGAPVPAAPGAVRAQAPLRFPTATVKASTILPDLDKYKGPPLEYGRMEATASDPAVQQQFGMIVGIPHAGQVNALATLNIRGERSVTCRGDFDRHVSEGPLPPGAPLCARSSAGFPTRWNVRLSSMRRMDGIPTSSRCRCMASSFRSRIRSTRKTCAPPAGVTRATTSISRRVITGWSHSSGTRGRSSSPRLSTRNTTAGPAIRVAATPRPGAAVDAGLSAQHLGRQSRQPLRHDTGGLARLEFGIGGVGQHQSGDGQPRGGNAGVLPRTGQSQRRGAHPAAQVAARLHRRCDRGGHLLRSQRHSLPHDRRLRQSPRCPEGPDRRLLRSARSLHDRAALVGIAHAIREPRADARHPWRARGHAPRDHPGVHGVRSGVEGRAADHHRGRQGDQDDPRRLAGGDAGGIVRSPVETGSRDRDYADRFPARTGQAGARVHARATVQARARRTAPLQRSSRPRSCRPSSCPARSSARAPCSRSTIASRWRRNGSRPRRTSISPPSRSRSSRWRSGSISRNT